MRNNQKGNVLVYILIAVAILAAITYTVTRDSGGQQQGQLSEAEAKLYATKLITHATQAQTAVEQLKQWGIDYDQMRFDQPGDAGYGSNTSEQIYHPAGGGLAPFNIKDAYFDGNGTTGWAFQGNVNIDWTDTSATDLIFTFINLHDDICAAVNQQMRGDPTIPASTVDFTNTFTESATDDPFIAAECAACEKVVGLCITDGTTNAFYNILGAR